MDRRPVAHPEREGVPAARAERFVGRDSRGDDQDRLAALEVEAARGEQVTAGELGAGDRLGRDGRGDQGGVEQGRHRGGRRHRRQVLTAGHPAAQGALGAVAGAVVEHADRVRPHRRDDVRVGLPGEDRDRGVGDAEAGGLLGDLGDRDATGLAHPKVVVVDQVVQLEQAVEGREDQDPGAGALGDRLAGRPAAGRVRAGVLAAGRDQARGLTGATGHDHDRRRHLGDRGRRFHRGAGGRVNRGGVRRGGELGGRGLGPGVQGGAQQAPAVLVGDRGGVVEGGPQGAEVELGAERAAAGRRAGGAALVVADLPGHVVLEVGLDVRGVDLGLLGGFAGRRRGVRGGVPELRGVAERVDDLAGGVADRDAPAVAGEGDQHAVAVRAAAASVPVARLGVLGVAVVGPDRCGGVRHSVLPVSRLGARCPAGHVKYRPF